MDAPSAQSVVCVVGSLNMDLSVRTPRIPAPGETVLGGSVLASPGGKGANQAVAAARMGAKVSMVGCIGDDDAGRQLRRALEAECVEVSHLRVIPGQATGQALITVADGGENTIVVAPGANALLSVEDVRAAADVIGAADVLLMQLEIPLEAVAEAARIARARGRSVILNAAPAQLLPRDILALVDVLIVNRTEAAILLGMDTTLDPARLAVRLPGLGPLTQIITQGALGAILTHKGRPRRVPTVRVQAVDSVGAGDAFCGALAASWGAVHTASLARDHDEFRFAETAAIRAAVAGAFATTRPGAMAALPRRDEVEPLAKTLKIVG
jgi:ribokinase